MSTGRERWLRQAEANTTRRRQEREVLLRHLQVDHKVKGLLDTDGLEELRRDHKQIHLAMVGEA